LTFPDGKETILFLVEEDDFVAARLNFQGTQTGPVGPFPATGKKLNADFTCIFKVINGKITESWVEYDNLDVLIQLGHYRLPGVD
jgi:predicted ester cyclase